jgi:hypothetical protein
LIHLSLVVFNAQCIILALLLTKVEPLNLADLDAADSLSEGGQAAPGLDSCAKMQATSSSSSLLSLPDDRSAFHLSYHDDGGDEECDGDDNYDGDDDGDDDDGDDG